MDIVQRIIKIEKALCDILRRLKILEQGGGSGGDQNNMTKVIFVDADNIPEFFTVQDVIDAVMALPESERTVSEIDSVINVGIGYPATEDFPRFIFEVYEIQNQGKGVITSLTEDNLIIKTYDINRTLELGDTAYNKSFYIEHSNGYNASYGSAGLNYNDSNTNSTVVIQNSAPIRPRIMFYDPTYLVSVDNVKIGVQNLAAGYGYEINFPDPADTVGATRMYFPSNMQQQGNMYVLVHHEDLARTSSTLSPISATNLNNNYGEKHPGFRLQCPNIGLIYEKTQTGWLTINATITT